MVCLPAVISSAYPDLGFRPSPSACRSQVPLLALKRRLIFIGLIIVVQVVSIGLNGRAVLLREAGELP